jgi:hypothetical protein
VIVYYLTQFSLDKVIDLGVQESGVWLTPRCAIRSQESGVQESGVRSMANATLRYQEFRGKKKEERRIFFTNDQ